MAGTSVRIFAAFSLTMVSSLAALDAGRRYDFFCHDGQDVFNAEYVSEDSSRYFVKLSALVTSVPIEKAFVRDIQESRPAGAGKQRELHLAGSLGAVAATGRLASFSAFAPAASLSLQRQIDTRFSAAVRADAARFQREGISLTLVSLMAGAEYTPQFSVATFTGALGVGIGGAYTHGSTESATVRAVIPAGIAYFALRRVIAVRYVFSISVSALYFHDRLNPLALPGILAGVEYRL